jgi:hypothetical protein
MKNLLLKDMASPLELHRNSALAVRIQRDYKQSARSPFRTNIDAISKRPEVVSV